MAAKKIITSSLTGSTIYCIIRRETDNFLLNDADGSFAASPADPYLSLNENTIIKGIYEITESRQPWNAGNYTIFSYKQSGGSPVPVSDNIIGQGDMYVVEDTEVDVLTELNSIDRNAFLIESQRGAHTWQGNIYYVDPVNGDTHANGARGGRYDPYSSVQDCHDNAVTDSNHDVVILISGDSAAVTTLTEDVTLTKRYTFYRGPGRDFIWTRSGAGDTITINGDGIEISGCQINTDSIGNGNGIDISGADFVKVRYTWINDTRCHAISATSCDNIIIEHNNLQHSGQGGAGHGIVLDVGGGTCNFSVIRNNYIYHIAGDGIKLIGFSEHAMVLNNILYHCSGRGINIGVSSLEVYLRNNGYGFNTNGDILDNGTNTVRDEDGIVYNSEYITDDVWDEILTSSTHNINRSSGKRLRQYAAQIVIDGIAAGPGANGNQIVLDNNASTMDGAYDPSLVLIIEGTGVGQSRLILEYDGPNRTATVDRGWKVEPDIDSEYIIFANPGREHVNEGLARGGTINTITLNKLASDDDDSYKGQVVFIRSGLGEDQARHILNYDGTTKVAIIVGEWSHIPDTTSAYVMLPTAHFSVVDVAEQLLANGLAAETSVQSVHTDLKRALGLMHENIFIDNPVYDDSGNMIEARIRIYSDSFSVGTENNVIGTYEVSTDAIGAGKFNNWKQIKV